MNNSSPSRRIQRVRLFLVGIAILIIGLGAAAHLYATASEERSDVLRYEMVDGEAYPVLAADSKQYRHDLERFGGKAAVFADDLNRWFSGLWRGRKLAFSIAALSVLIAAPFFRTAFRPGKPKD